MQSIPQNIRIRDKIIPCTIIAGVSTDINYGGRGLMSIAFKYYMEHITDLGYGLTVHTPAKLPTFFSKGHLPATNTLRLTKESAHGSTVLKSASAGELYNCYMKFSEKYSGIISRSYPDFVFKMMDYESTGGKNIALYKDDKVVGYAIYFEDENVYGEEIAAVENYAYDILIDALSSIAGGRRLECKLPPDAVIDVKDAITELRPQGVAGIASLPVLLKSVIDIAEYSVEVNDKVVSQNNGCFDLSGRKTEKKPQIRISSGHLMQLIEGYKTIDELSAENEIEICDHNVIDDFRKIFSKQNCFIFDEY